VYSSFAAIVHSARAGRSGDRISMGARFFGPVRWVPAFILGGGGVEWPGRGVDHPLPSSAAVKEGVELYLYFLSRVSWPVVGRTFLLFTVQMC
jgi:hypothetical protein